MNGEKNEEMNGENRCAGSDLPPIFPSGLTLGELDLAGGSVFWDEVARFTAQAKLEDVLDQAAGGKPVPRVWVILDEPENTASRSAAALALARTMSQREQKVLVMDADDHHPDLSFLFDSQLHHIHNYNWIWQLNLNYDLEKKDHHWNYSYKERIDYWVMFLKSAGYFDHM